MIFLKWQVRSSFMHHCDLCRRIFDTTLANSGRPGPPKSSRRLVHDGSTTLCCSVVRHYLLDITAFFDGSASSGQVFATTAHWLDRRNEGPGILEARCRW